MDRLERLRQVVDGILAKLANAEDRRCGFVHLYRVSAAAALLALRRGESVELAAAAGMLHDLSTYEDGTSEGHAQRSARRAAGLLRSLDAFTDSEIDVICSAISRHGDKATRHGSFDELLKDADVLEHFLYHPDLPPLEAHAARRTALRLELGLSFPAPPDNPSGF
jgi:hypothetical protein